MLQVQDPAENNNHMDISAKEIAVYIIMIVIGLLHIIVVLSIFLGSSLNIFASLLKSVFPVLSRLALVIQLLLCIPLVITIMKNNQHQENNVSFYAHIN